MIIKNIKLKNFGGHASINFDTEGEKVIGLLGANGSGKTTLLSAIKYAITGDLEGTIESNIKKGATSGSVEIVFIKNGKEGTIIRKLGKTSKAHLTWDEKEYKAKKEIEKVLQTLVGGDKQALANAVFMAQGSLNKLLFGSETEREQLFVRLNNLSYLQKFSDIIDQRSKVLQDVNDLLPTMDALNEQRIDLLSRREGYENTLANMEDLASVIALMKEEQATKELIESLGLSKMQTTEKMHEVTNQVSKILGDMTTKELEEETKELKEAIDLANTNKAECKASIVEYRAYVEMSESINEEKARLEVANKMLSDAQVTEDKEHYNEKIDATLENLGKLEFEISQLKAWKKAQDATLVGDCEHGSVCDSCGLAVVNTGHEGFKLGLDPENNLDSLIGEKETLHDQLNEQRKEYTRFLDMLVARNNVQTKWENLREEAQKKFSDITSFEDPKPEDERLTKLLAELSTKLSKLESTKNKFISEKGSLNALGETWNALITQINDKKEYLDSEKFTPLGEYNEELSVYEERQILYNEVKSKLNETNILLESVTKKYGDILEKEEKNSHKKKLHKELQGLKDAFSKKGIPRAYINSKFDIITELTQRNLDILGTDFFIEPSEEKSLAFDFTRFVNGEKLKLPMSKLSGGQRVRLSLSFILSIQQLVMSEIGFITLDEPSTHLDEEGIDSLGDLLKKIRMIFADSEHQLWVCDHNPKLEASFDKTLILQ